MEDFTKDDIRDCIIDMILNDVHDDAAALYAIGMIQVMDRLLNRDGLDIWRRTVEHEIAELKLEEPGVSLEEVYDETN